ncbi:MAG: radical SAM protein [Candidatus Margulisiibacteriota bacterium]
MRCDFYFTLRCNAYCEFCKIWQDKDLSQVKESFVKQLPAFFAGLKLLGVKTINFTGGEPLIRDDLPEAAALAASNGFKINLFTNGILYPAVHKKLEGNVDTLFVSLDAPTEKEHDRIRGQECFIEALESVSIAVSKKQKTVINFTLTRDSLQYLPDMVELAEKLKVKIKINPVYDYFGLDGFEKESIAYIGRFLKNKWVILNRSMLELVNKGGNNINSPVCRALDNVVTVFPDLSLILPCFRLRQAIIPAQGDIVKTFGSDIVKGYRKLQGKTNDCAGCMMWEYLVSGE